jgi:phage regulator Rha-like protein
MTALVLLKNNEPLTTSLIVSRELKRTHKSISNLIKQYRKDFDELENKVIEFEMSQRHGKPTIIYYLNEQQLTFLIMMLRVKQNENDKVLEFKKKITKEFFNMRKWILEQKTQKQNQQYIETRNRSKIGRKQETDIIKDFIQYAKKQGSKSADRYYMLFSKMENSAFFMLQEKFKNVREILNITQLSKIIVADMIVKTAIIEGMKKELFYKEIFQIAKKRVVEMSNSLGVKEVLPNIEFKQIEFNNLNK